MFKKRADIDIIHDVLEAALAAKPASDFLQSLQQQYIERGGLSKKQLQGLHSIALKIPDMAADKLATLEAEINKKPNRYKSPLPEAKPLYIKDEHAGQLIETILAKAPQHKRVLFLKARYDTNETLTAVEIAELEKFNKLFINK